MADGGRAWKVWDRFIFQPCLDINLLGEATQPGAQNNARPGLFRPMFANNGNGFSNLICEMEHSRQLTWIVGGTEASSNRCNR